MDSLSIMALEIVLIVVLGIVAFTLITLKRSSAHASGKHMVAAGPQYREHAEQRPNKPRNRPAGHHPTLRSVDSHPHDTSVADITAQLHILASVQMLDARRQGIELRSADKNLKSLAAAYLYGASIALTFSTALDQEEAFALAVKTISYNLGMGEVSVNQMLAHLTRSSSSLECYRNGLEGAEFWTTHRYVPRNQSLYVSLTGNALI